MADEMKAQRTSKLAAMIPQIMNALGGGDAKTAALLAQQRQVNEGQIKNNNMRSFMRAVTSPDTGEITEQTIMKYADMFNVAPQDAMKVINDFATFKKSQAPANRPFSRQANGMIQTVEAAAIPQGDGWQEGKLAPIPGNNRVPIKVDDGQGGWKLIDPEAGATGRNNPSQPQQKYVKVDDGRGGYKFVIPGPGVSGMNNPSKGMRIETGPDGTLIQTNVAGGGELTRGTKTNIQKNIIGANSTYADMKATIMGYDDKYLLGKSKLGYGWSAFKEKWNIGDVTDTEKKELEKYTAFKRDSVSALNNYIKDITGAAMSEVEAKRLMKAMPNPGIGMFDGDSPTQFKAKLHSVMKNLDRVIARNNYIQNHGLTSIEKIGLSQIDGLIDQRGEELEIELKTQGVPVNEIDGIVTKVLEEEFGVKF